MNSRPGTARRPLPGPEEADFWVAWILLATSLIQITAFFTLIAAVSLAAAAIVRLATWDLRARARASSHASVDRSPPVVPWWPLVWMGVLIAPWAAFWALDLHQARVRVILLVVPFGSVVFAVAHRVLSRRRGALYVWTFAGIAAGLALIAAHETLERRPLMEAGLAVATSFVAIALTVTLSRPRPATPPEAVATWRKLAAGAALGLAYPWGALVLRSDNGCTGVSGVYTNTLLLTAVVLFGMGPAAIARLLMPSQRVMPP